MRILTFALAFAGNYNKHLNPLRKITKFLTKQSLTLFCQKLKLSLPLIVNEVIPSCVLKVIYAFKIVSVNKVGLPIEVRRVLSPFFWSQASPLAVFLELGESSRRSDSELLASERREDTAYSKNVNPF